MKHRTGFRKRTYELADEFVCLVKYLSPTRIFKVRTELCQSMCFPRGIPRFEAVRTPRDQTRTTLNHGLP